MKVLLAALAVCLISISLVSMTPEPVGPTFKDERFVRLTG